MPPSKKNVSLSQLRVGIFVLLAIGVLIFLVLNASGDINPFSRKLHLKARFVDANGLREGSEVRLAGVRVGKVERIVLLEPSPVPGAPRVEAQLTVDSTIDVCSFNANIVGIRTAVAPPFSWAKKSDNRCSGGNRNVRRSSVTTDVNF